MNRPVESSPEEQGEKLLQKLEIRTLPKKIC
jgi:hypothetical protein